MKCAAEVPRIGSMALVCVDPAKINEFWPLVEGFIERALYAGPSDESAIDVRADLLQGKALLWIVWDDLGKTILAAGTTKIVPTARGKICIFNNCAGRSMRLWHDFIEALEQYAKDEGCKYTRIYGRPGWERILPGYAKPWVTLEKVL